MDLDTAIDMVRELGDAWKTTGAPHQQELGEAMLLITNAWITLHVAANTGQLLKALVKPVPIDPFLVRAEAARVHAAQPKPAPIGRIADTRVVSAPLVSAEGLGDIKTTSGSAGTGLAAATPQPRQAAIIEALEKAADEELATIKQAAEPKPRRMAKKS